MKKTRFENIDEYNKNPNKCKYCGKPIIATYNDKLANIKRKTFCNSSCAASYNNSHGQHRPQKGVSYCLNCGNVTKKVNKFCSCKCSSNFQYKQYIKKWKNGEVNGLQKNKWNSYSSYIRRYLFEKYNNKCARCGWGEKNKYSNTIPLEVEHIDGDSTNNNEDNLTLLCPNCHSLTSTYRGLNRGHGTRNITWRPIV